MKTKKVKPFILIGCLIAVTCIAMAGAQNIRSTNIDQTAMNPTQTISHKNGIVTLTGSLVQDKIIAGGDGIVSLALTLATDDINDGHSASEGKNLNSVDMVIVLDRSGSMGGQKINDAKNAVISLISKLTPSDRFALVTYSDTAQNLSGLVHVTPSVQNRLSAMINNISANGGTNLGQGLQNGIDLLTLSAKTGNTGRLILISDGLANKGITDINSLGRMASMAVQKEFTISTAGVGTDFNETLMTAIADYGTGNYHFLENPAAFASVFNQEFEHSRTAAATAVQIRFDGKNGIALIDAGGYPIRTEKNTAVFSPGDLRSGETRRLFLSLKVPSDRAATFDLSGISLGYQYNGDVYRVSLPGEFKLACVNDPRAAIASIDKEAWESKVLKEDFSRLKETVAGDIRSGRKEEAVKKIEQYYSDQQTINASIQSEAVADNLDHDLKVLRDTVDETFSGKPAAVAEKQKKNAKVLQFDGYQERRKN